MLPPGARPWRASCPAFNSCWDPGMQPPEPQVQIMPAPWKQQSQHPPSQPGPGPRWPMRQGARSPPCALHMPASSLLPFVQHDPCPVLGADLSLTVSWYWGICHVSLMDCGLPEVGALPGTEHRYVQGTPSGQGTANHEGQRAGVGHKESLPGGPSGRGALALRTCLSPVPVPPLGVLWGLEKYPVITDGI